MKIECTAEQKKLVLDALDNASACVLTDVKECHVLPCRYCLERNIEWVVPEKTPEEGEAKNDEDH